MIQVACFLFSTTMQQVWDVNKTEQKRQLKKKLRWNWQWHITTWLLKTFTYFYEQPHPLRFANKKKNTNSCKTFNQKPNIYVCATHFSATSVGTTSKQAVLLIRPGERTCVALASAWFNRSRKNYIYVYKHVLTSTTTSAQTDFISLLHFVHQRVHMLIWISEVSHTSLLRRAT